MLFDERSPIGFRFQKISWPAACIGCGTQKETDFISQRHKIEREVERKSSGGFVDTVVHQSFNVDAHLHLCSSCEQFAESEQRALRIKGSVGALIALMLTLTLSYFLNIYSANPSISIFFLMLIALSAPLGFKILQLSRYYSVQSPFRSFYNVSFTSSGGFLEFRSRSYYEKFKEANTDPRTPASHNERIRLASGNEDGGTDIAFTCAISPGCCVLGFVAILTVLGGFRDLFFFLPILGSVGLILILTYIVEAGFYGAFRVSQKGRM